MNIACGIIKDLLPLYHDGVCCDESKEMVDKHLVECKNCRAELEAMDSVLFIQNVEWNLKEAEAVKKLAERWKRGMLKSVFKGIIFTIITVIVMFLVLYLLLDFRLM